MIGGKATVLSMAKMTSSIVTLGPKMESFAKKYPGMFTFYAKGEYLPDDRKLYKYRFIRINPSKIVYWTGYTFGRYIPSKSEEKQQGNVDLADESRVEGIAGLLGSADEEVEPDELPLDEDWLAGLNSAVSSGIVQEDEKKIIELNKIPIGVTSDIEPGKLSSGEKSLLKKWKESTKNK